MAENMFLSIPRPTKDFHQASYPSISPSRPELSVKGQTVLITGGATGIGLETSKAFAEAGAGTIAMLARSQGPMDVAKETIEAEYPNTKVATFAASVTESARINEIARELGTIDILMLNAGTMHALAPTLDIDAEDLLNNFKVNVIGPFSLIKAFMALPPRDTTKPRTIIYTSTAAAAFVMPGASGYSASKAAMTYLMASIAQEYGGSGVRAFAFHPAVAYTTMAKEAFGAGPDTFAYDAVDLPARFAVWLCSPEADFLKGRFLWSNWDVEELKAKKDIILNDPSQLQIGLVQNKVVV